jgi:hypothetical protein
MKFDYIKSRQGMISKGLFVFSAFLAGALIFKVAAFGYTSYRLPVELQEAHEQSKPSDEAVEKNLSNWRESGEKLKKDHMFAPPKPKRPAPTCMGIIGDCALFGDKLYKEGQDVGGGKIVAVGPTDVTILWEGQEKKLVPFSVETKYDSKKTAPPAKPGQAAPVVQVAPAPAQDRRPTSGQGPRGQMGLRGGMFNMSPEQMRQARERFMNMSPEERERFRSERRGRSMGRRRN